MGKLSEILGRKNNDDDDSADQPQEEPTASTQDPEGDASHPPAAMPADASPGAAPADVPDTFSSIEEYESTLPVPDVAPGS